MERDPNCTLCPLHKSARTVCIDGDGPEDAKIVIVGQNPGRQEDRYGRPFVGESGKLLKTELQRAGFDDDAIRFTNVVRCLTPANRKPTPQEIKTCKAYLETEIASVQPEYIVTLGEVASKLLAKKTKVTQAHGEIVELNGSHIMPMYHPAYVLRDPSKLPAFQHDLARLMRSIKGTLGKDSAQFNYKVIHTAADFDQFLSEFEAAEEFSYDTETNSLFTRWPEFLIRCMSIGLRQRAWVLPLQMPGSFCHGNYKLQMDLIFLLTDLAKGKFAVVQNGKYDDQALLQRYGTTFTYDFDVMLAHHVIDENQDHDLKYMARVYLDSPDYDLPKKDKVNPDLTTPEKRERYWEYSARDGWNTFHLHPIFARTLRESMPLRRLYNRLTLPGARVMCGAEREGLTTDHIQYAKIEARTREEFAASEKRLNEFAGSAINWDSPAQVAKLLYGQLGLKTKVKTETGALSTGELALADLKDKHPVIRELLRYRELGKFLGTYLEGWKDFMVGDQLYLSYKIHGTVTGRYSSRLHQIPIDSDVRSIVTAPPGWEFVSADLPQAELRVVAHMSGDLEMISCFRPGGADIHWRTLLYMIGSGRSAEYTKPAVETAAQLKGSRASRMTLTDAVEILRIAGHKKSIALWEDWKEGRVKAKRINFGFIYGMYENTFIEKAKADYEWYCTWDEAHGFREAYFELYSSLPSWHKRVRSLVRINGEVTNLFGRVRRLPGINSSDKGLRMEIERQAINCGVQSTIGDWKVAAMIEIAETIPHTKLKIVGEHHDALMMNLKEGCRDEVLPRVRAIMSKPKLLDTFKVKLSVPMGADIEVGPWGKGDAYEDPIRSQL